MSDAVNPAGEALPDANASPETTVEADANTGTPGSEAAPSPAVKKADDDVTEKVRSRFDELTKNWRTAERDRDYWRELAMQSQAKPEPEPVTLPAESTAKTLADFGFDEAKYQTYLFTESAKAAKNAAKEELRQEQERESSERRKSQFASRERDFAKTQADYYEVTRSPDLTITQAMVDAAAESDEAAALLYHLAKNPEKAQRIAQLPPLAAAREIGRIEAALIGEREKAKTKTVSGAPPPPPKIEGAGDPAVEKDPGQMTDKEFAKWRAKQIAQRNSR